MRPSRFIRSLQLAGCYSKFLPSRRSFSIVIVAIALAWLSLGHLHHINRMPQMPALQFGARRSQASANPSVLQLGGGWDFLWKDQRAVLLRTHCQIRQKGAALTLHLRDPQLLDLDQRMSIQGTLENKTISFHVQLRDGGSVTFVGVMEDGLLYGTTSRGFSWIALRDPND
jgi:hypothetical protein